MRTIAALLIVLALQAVTARQPGAVRAWEGSLDLPTTVEGPPSPNPPFDLLALGRFNYPYTLRTSLTDRERVVRYRALFLENDLLELTVLPELGGHVYSCLDKTSGHDLFYANRSIKKALIGYRGAWAAFGVEFNFPISHNWMSLSPVDSALVANPDGSASIWVGHVDAVFGSEWRVELRLRPGRAVLEQHTTLTNQGDASHRYYWWTNAAVRATDDSHLEYPTHLMATHGFTAVVPWPEDDRGRDLSVIRNQTDGPVSLFTYGTREPFMAVWDPGPRFGTVHVAPVADLPTDKVWSWGADREAHEWRKALSDDDSAYVELQAGLFRNQETYAMLGPEEQVHFTEYWLPARDIGGVTRATTDAVFHAARRRGGVEFELAAARRIADAHVRVRQGRDVLLDRRVALSPATTWRETVPAPAGRPWVFDLLDADGHVLLSHVEGRYDALTPADVAVGPRPSRRLLPMDAMSASDLVELGHDQELNGRRLQALSTYRSGLARFPDNAALARAAGRLATSLGWVEARVQGSPARDPQPLAWLSEAYRRDTTDMKTRYYLGLAEAAAGHDREAIGHFEAAQRFAPTRAASLVQLARLAARHGSPAEAAAWLEPLATLAPLDAHAGAIEVACLRRAGRVARARAALAHWRAVDPASRLLRYEAVRLGATDAALWRDLAADPAGILGLADEYRAIGADDDALDLLDRRYPDVEEPAAEPGSVPPSRNPLIAYYRGFVKAALGRSPADDYEAASALSTLYVFPNRRSTYAVLGAALRAHPEDATALALRGALYLSSGLVAEALADWQAARRLAPDTPALHRNLGLALRHEGRVDEAIGVLREGIAHDSRNVEVYAGLDRALSAAAAAPADRVAALERYPDQAHLPPPLVVSLALAKAERGDADFDALFAGRYFPREEGGVSPERVLVAARIVAARRAAASGDCARALADIAGATRVPDGMATSADALGAEASQPLMQRWMAGVERRCGRLEASRRRWADMAGRLQDADAPMALVLRHEAAVALDRTEPDAAESLRAALDTVTASLEAGDSSAPATLAWTRAELLAALGRRDDARTALARAFQYPDSNLAHLGARMLREDLEEDRRP